MLSELEKEVCKRLSSVGYGTYEELCGVLSVKSLLLLPWCGVLEGKCKSLRYNSGLYTQCENVVEGDRCVRCEKESVKNGGVSKYGTVREREMVGVMEYKDARGKGVVSYVEVMRKNGIRREDVERECLRRGISVYECHFEEKESVRRGRPRKEKKDECEKKKRGRPRKSKEVVSNNAGEELIASLLCRERLELDGLESVELESVELESEDEETEVVKFKIGDIWYLKSVEKVLYDIESHECVGLWNENSNTIEKIIDEYEE